MNDTEPDYLGMITEFTSEKIRDHIDVYEKTLPSENLREAWISHWYGVLFTMGAFSNFAIEVISKSAREIARSHARDAAESAAWFFVTSTTLDNAADAAMETVDDSLRSSSLWKAGNVVGGAAINAIRQVQNSPHWSDEKKMLWDSRWKASQKALDTRLQESLLSLAFSETRKELQRLEVSDPYATGKLAFRISEKVILLRILCLSTLSDSSGGLLNNIYDTGSQIPLSTSRKGQRDVYPQWSLYAETFFSSLQGQQPGLLKPWTDYLSKVADMIKSLPEE